MTKAGFRNSDGWMPKNPAARALDLVTEQQRDQNQPHRDGEDDDRHAPHLARSEKGDGDQHGNGGDQRDRLPVDEMEGGQVDALGHRGTRRHGKDHAGDDEDGECGKQPAVDGPPPVGQGCPLRARHHQRDLTAGTARHFSSKSSQGTINHAFHGVQARNTFSWNRAQ